MSQRGRLQLLIGGRHRNSARGTQSVHWYSRIWPTDNRDVTEVKTAGPLQIMPGRKARGSPCPPTQLHSVVMVIKSVQYHYVTLMWAHSFPFPLFFLSLSLCHAPPKWLQKRLSCILYDTWYLMDIPGNETRAVAKILQVVELKCFEMKFIDQKWFQHSNSSHPRSASTNSVPRGIQGKWKVIGLCQLSTVPASLSLPIPYRRC